MADILPMTENKRTQVRNRSLLGAKLEFNLTGGVSCLVRNVSPSGACLLFEDEVLAGTVPDKFDLFFDRDKSKRGCAIKWRKGPLVGVAFK